MMNNLDWFQKWADYSPNKIAFKEYEDQQEYSFDDLNRLANQAVRLLNQKYNIKKGDRIAVLAENCIEYIVLFSVAQKIGITIVPLNFRLSVRELEFIIANSKSSLLIVDSVFEHLVSEKIKENQLSLDEFRSEIESTESAEQSFIRKNSPQENDGIFIIYTSGTTSFPKGAVYTHKMLFWNSINTELRLNITSDDKSLSCAPPFHTGGWNVLLTPFLHHGAYTLLMKKFEPDLILKLLDEEEMTLWWAVPTMLKMMSDSEVFDKVKLQKLRYFVVGGESMPIPLIEKWHEKGVLIRQGYGLTEVGPNVTSLSHEDAIRKQGSIGKSNFYYQTKIVKDNGTEAEANEEGELWISGPTVTPGYWQNEEATDKAISSGWFKTGDIVKMDDEGYFYVVDRIKNMYISGGENVYPAEVEYQINKHPKISEVAIIGVTDEKWGETGKAFIVVKPDEKITEREIVDYCKERLAKYKIPKHVIFIDELPKNHAGKIDRKKLKEMEK